jgi:anti-sigma B factor antagonist
MFVVRMEEAGRVALQGRLDASQADLAQEQLGAYSGSLTLDCAQLDYISSAGIGVVVETFKRLSRSGGEFKLVNVPPRIRTVFRYAGLDRVIPME